MIRSLYRRYFTKQNPLSHYVHHFLVANLALFASYIIFGSITLWEVVLFFFMAFIPVLDEFLYVVLHYLDDESCRRITHLFIGGEYGESFTQLHAKRHLFTQLVLHNLVLYLALWSLLFVFLMFDIPLAFYGLAGLLTHLMQDIANDQYEYGSFHRWLWPVGFVFNRNV